MLWVCFLFKLSILSFTVWRKTWPRIEKASTRFYSLTRCMILGSSTVLELSFLEGFDGWSQTLRMDRDSVSLKCITWTRWHFGKTPGYLSCNQAGLSVEGNRTFDPKFVLSTRCVEIKMEQRLRERAAKEWPSLKLFHGREPTSDTVTNTLLWLQTTT